MTRNSMIYNRQQKIRERCEEIENELKPAYNRARKEIRKEYELNPRKKWDRIALNFTLDKIFAYTDLAKEYQKLVREFWSL